MSGRKGRIRAAVAALVVGPAALLAPAAGSNGPGIVSVGPEGQAADGPSYEAAVSTTGRVVAFRSQAANLSPLASAPGDRIYLRDLASGTTTLVSAADGEAFAGAYNPNVSANGRWVLFQTYHPAREPDSGGESDLYLLDRRKGTLRLVTVNADGESADADAFMDGAAMSSNGRYAVVYTRAGNLVTEEVNGTTDQIVLVDMKKGTFTLLSRATDGSPADGSCGQPSIAANGKWVAFTSRATNLVAGPTGTTTQVFLCNVRKRTLVLASRGPGGDPADANAAGPVVANNGVVAFHSAAANLLQEPDAETSVDVFLFDPRQGGTVRKVSTVADGERPAGSAGKCAIASRGSPVAFVTTQALDPADTNGLRDVYAFDVPTGTLRLVSREAGGNGGNAASDLYSSSVSVNGRWLAYSSRATDLADGDANGVVDDILLVDLRR